MCIGGSCIIDPYGHYVVEPLWHQAGIIYADIDMQKVPMSRMEFDGIGHYSHDDILKLMKSKGSL
ncbi:nitrilase-related carbon-nitrogen hydrolase [Periweissella beninensis]|uniref:nitrilase-related carbon-nitrogen hydrolase n=1 Tax=Periweissella beninensis TaxID=504936 RepID=UPI0021A5FA5F|nr:nitrilase-related carbon-nitrogen hydrolase [Periweissella beninensis]